MILLVIYGLIAIVFSSLCSILESVFLSTTPSFVESYAKKHPRVGGYLKHLKANVEDAEGAILVLNTFAVTATATGFGIELNELYGEQWQFAGSILFAIAMIYITEIFPKTLGATYWQSLAPSVAVCIHYLLKITFPFVLVAKLIIRLLSFGAEASTSREEVLAASEIGKKGGSLNEREVRLIKNLLTLKKYQAADILTPRSVVFACKFDDKIKDIIALENFPHHSHIPVYAQNTETIIGIVHSSELLAEAVQQEGKSLGDFIRPVYVVRDNISVLSLLHICVSKKERFFIVQDRFGQFFGVVSFEDIIETLLGEEIVDEFDEAVDMQKFAREKIQNMKERYLARVKDGVK